MAFEIITPAAVHEWMAAHRHQPEGNIALCYEALALRFQLDLPAMIAEATRLAVGLRLTPNQTLSTAYGLVKEALHTAINKITPAPVPFPRIP